MECRTISFHTFHTLTSTAVLLLYLFVCAEDRENIAPHQVRLNKSRLSLNGHDSVLVLQSLQHDLQSARVDANEWRQRAESLNIAIAARANFVAPEVVAVLEQRIIDLETEVKRAHELLAQTRVDAALLRVPPEKSVVSAPLCSGTELIIDRGKKKTTKKLLLLLRSCRVYLLAQKLTPVRSTPSHGI